MTERRVLAVACLGLCGVVAGAAHGAGFALIEQGATGVGTAFAGSAAYAHDASIQFFNPAGLSLVMNPQFVAAVHLVDLRLDFSDRGSTLPAAGLGALPTGATAADAGGRLAVPTFHASLPLGRDLTAGLSVSVPFGLETQYPDGWVGRFQGIHSELRTINVNPAVAWRPNRFVALGAGVSLQYASAKLTNAVLLAPGTEGRARLDVDDESWGWNVGLLVFPVEGLRVGIAYRSQVRHELAGTLEVTRQDGVAVPAAGEPVRAPLRLPDSLTFSVAQAVGSRWTLLGDATFLRWSEVGQIRATGATSGAVRDALEFGFRDEVRFSAGANFQYSPRWTFRAGVAWDRAPTSDRFRSVRLPDADRVWLAAGAGWQATQRVRVDAGYARLLIQDTGVSQLRIPVGAPASFGSNIRGGYDSGLGLYSLQLTLDLR
jgi:long-chain fatty acid transport protein